MDSLGPGNFGVILLLCTGYPLSEINLYCHGPVYRDHRTYPL